MTTIRVLQSLSDAGRQWVKENVVFEPYQELDGGIAVEARYVEAIVEGMMADGLKYGEDFKVSDG